MIKNVTTAIDFNNCKVTSQLIKTNSHVPVPAAGTKQVSLLRGEVLYLASCYAVHMQLDTSVGEQDICYKSLPVLSPDLDNPGGPPVRKFLTANTRLLSNSSEIDHCQAAQATPRAFRTVGGDYVAMSPGLIRVATPRAFSQLNSFVDEAGDDATDAGIYSASSLAGWDLSLEWLVYKSAITSIGEVGRARQASGGQNTGQTGTHRYFDGVWTAAASLSIWSKLRDWMEDEVAFWGGVVYLLSLTTCCQRLLCRGDICEKSPCLRSGF
jgi:hypothetical protein